MYFVALYSKVSTYGVGMYSVVQLSALRQPAGSLTVGKEYCRLRGPVPDLPVRLRKPFKL